MRTAFAHDALLDPDPALDHRAPGGAVTLALCGSLDHEPPCPLAPHHTTVDAEGALLRVRVLFAVDAADEARVRSLVDARPGQRRVGRTPTGWSATGPWCRRTQTPYASTSASTPTGSIAA